MDTEMFLSCERFVPRLELVLYRSVNKLLIKELRAILHY
jgi:hypothetical protein